MNEFGGLESHEPPPDRWDGGINANPTYRFKVQPFEDFGHNIGAPYLVKGMIPREGLIVVWGPPKCGKSFWICDVLFHVALDWQYRGRRITQGTIIYVCLEGERGIGSRIEAFRRSRLAEIVTPIPFYVVATRLDLATDHKQLINEVKAQLGQYMPVVAIVFDTLNRSLAGSESSDEDMGGYVRSCDAVREAFRCAVIVVHHCGHEATRPRGHTSLLGAADAQIAVKRNAADQIIATVEHMKDGATGAEIVSRLEIVKLDDDADGDPITSCVIEPIDGEPERRTSRTAKITGANRTALDLLVRAIDEKGEIPPANNHIPAGYRVVPVETWRQYCYQGMIAASTKQDAKCKAFGRASTALQGSGLVASHNDLVWVTSR